MELDEFLATQHIAKHDRRRFLKLMGGAGALAAYGTVQGTIAAQETAELVGPLNWYASGVQYATEEVLAPWLDETGVEINQTPWTGADEMAARMRAGGAEFDSLSAPQQWLQVFAEEGLIEPIDPTNVPNLEHTFPEFRDSPLLNFDGEVWGVPWVWGANAIAYNREELPEVTSMAALFDEQNSGRISMRDDPEDSIAVGALYLGIEDPYQMDDAALEEVKQLLISQKPLVRTYWHGLADLQTLFANGEVSVAWAQLGIVNPLREAGVDMGWVWPDEGALGWFNGNCTVAGTDKKRTAEAFANYLVGPDYGRLLGEETGLYTTSTLAIDTMSDELKEALDIDPARLGLLTFKDLFDRPKWQSVWDEVKAS